MTTIADLKLLSSGKVREIYEWEDDLLMVASDRISTYDVVMPTPIPDKVKVLNRMSVFWFGLTQDIVPNHFLSEDVPEEVAERAMRVRKLEMYPVECVVRGYLSGSGWKEYTESGSVCGIELPSGLVESDQLPEPIFTPATKAEIGDHDENVDFDRAAEIIGDRALLEELRRLSIAIYELGAEHARERGIILADTKFEIARRPDGTIVLGDEVLTPDSSRFWPVDGYEPGHGQPSFDKQFERDWAPGTGC
jgi:phosphoribosylaminoimidazole-succinocarboxamide synthase